MWEVCRIVIVVRGVNMYVSNCIEYLVNIFLLFEVVVVDD